MGILFMYAHDTASWILGNFKTTRNWLEYYSNNKNKLAFFHLIAINSESKDDDKSFDE